MDKSDKKYSYITCTMKIRKHLFFNVYNFFRKEILPFLERFSDKVDLDILEYVEVHK